MTIEKAIKVNELFQKLSSYEAQLESWGRVQKPISFHSFHGVAMGPVISDEDEDAFHKEIIDRVADRIKEKINEVKKEMEKL